jgi:hypothetical protein
MNTLRLLLVFILLQVTILVTAQKNCTHTIETQTSNIEGDGIAPGDTICLLPGQRSYLFIRNLNGTASQPIVIINRGGISTIDTDHFYGVKFSHCNHVKFIGTHDLTHDYGIRITRVAGGAGISVDELSTNIEIAYVEIAHTKVGGIYAKTDPDCSFIATREKFTMTGVHIHHCYLHDIADEGMYIGSSKYTGQHLTDCDTIVLPHVIHNVSIHDNIVERTGWDGIQVSSSPINCLIYNNIIKNDSERETPNQMSGILIGGGSDCDCYNNQIFDGKGDGIDIFGFGEMKIYNNLIVRAGKTYQPTVETAFRHGIFVGNAPDSASGRLKIMHNSIISPKTTGVRFFNSFTSGNLFFNNIITNPGSFAVNGANAYLNSDGSQSAFSIKNNIFSEHPENIGFMNLNDDNYDLKPGSSAVNNGFNAGLNKISFDILDRPRPHNGLFDIGAFESQDTYASIPENDGNRFLINIFPIPTNGVLYVDVDVKSEESLSLIVTDLLGKQHSISASYYLQKGSQQISIDLSSLSKGAYLLHLQRKANTIRRIVVIQ